MMIVVAVLMLLAPGLISTRILWGRKEISRPDYKFIISDYVIYSFLIQVAAYGFMWITLPERTVSFSAGTDAVSHILSASFVFKYSVVSLAAALILPACVSWLAKTWHKLEGDRDKK